MIFLIDDKTEINIIYIIIIILKYYIEEMKYLLKFIFPFLRSGVEVKRGVEFCH